MAGGVTRLTCPGPAPDLSFSVLSLHCSASCGPLRVKNTFRHIFKTVSVDTELSAEIWEY